MADPDFASNRRDYIKSSVGNIAASRRRQHAITVGKERRESPVRAKRLCREGIGGGEVEIPLDSEMMIDEEQSVLESQTSSAVEELKSAIAYQGKGAMQKRVSAVQEPWRLLSRSEFPPVEAALEAGAIPVLVQCLSFGSPDEQSLETAWCLTNIAAENPEETKALLPAWPLLVAHIGALSNVAICILVKSDVLQLLVNRLATSNSLHLLIPVLLSLGNLIAGDSNKIYAVLVPGRESTDSVIEVLLKCLRSEHRVLKQEAAWVLCNTAAGSVEHKQLIYSSEAVPLLLRLFAVAPFDVRKEVAYVLGNLCVGSTKGDEKPSVILEHLVSLVKRACLCGFIDLVRSADIEAARLGLQFIELVLRGLPNGAGPKLVEQEDGIEDMERFQFHEIEDLRTMASSLVDKYFGEDYGLGE